MNRVLDFDFSGTGGQTTTVITPSNQVVEFDFSGTVGERQLTQPIRQEITEFTFTGQAADAVGQTEIWGFDFTGSSDAFAAEIPGTAGSNEEFFIFLDGVATDRAVPAPTETIGTAIDYDNVGNVAANSWQGISATGQNEREVSLIANLRFGFTPAGGFWTLLGNTTPQPTVDTIVNIPDGENISITITSNTTNTDTATFEITGAVLFRSNGDLDMGPREVTGGGLAVTAGNDETFSVDHQFTITAINSQDAMTESTSVRLAIPTESIDRTYNIPTGTSGATDLRDNLLAQLQADTVITNEFTVAAANSDSGTTGVGLNRPIITLVANDNVDHSISVIFNNAGGDISDSRFGTHIEGSSGTPVTPQDTPTEIRITYDVGINPSMQDIVIGGASDSAAISNLSLIHI